MRHNKQWYSSSPIVTFLPLEVPGRSSVRGGAEARLAEDRSGAVASRVKRRPREGRFLGFSRRCSTCKEKGRVVVREADSVRGWLNAHSCQCELWRLTSGGAPELRRRIQRREGQHCTLTKRSLDVDVKTPCRRSCSYGSRRQRVASLGLSRVVSGRVSKAWWQIRLGVWHSQYRSIVTSGSLAPSSIYMFPTDGGRCHCLDPTFTGLQSLSLWPFRIN
ncbi:hypothetical protein F2Q69_00024100 [Brassica cretica]|uniref:Uncharacterized protein n=1 Tax=Brassica cretica TaxID=69181 RepID=A0A8S9QDZ5_BRACR|nr:hypothetical protein F2Q69_00024100 [Brassica cretica]